MSLIKRELLYWKLFLQLTRVSVFFFFVLFCFIGGLIIVSVKDLGTVPKLSEVILKELLLVVFFF